MRSPHSGALLELRIQDTETLIMMDVMKQCWIETTGQPGLCSEGDAHNLGRQDSHCKEGQKTGVRMQVTSVRSGLARIS